MAGPIPTKKIPQLTDYGAVLNGAELLEIWSVNTSRRVPARSLVLPTDSLITVAGMGGSLPGSRQLVSSPTVAVVDNGAGSTIRLETTDAVQLPVGLQAVALPAGPTHNLALAPVAGFLDLNTAAGDATVTGITPPASDGQVLIVTNTGANLLTMMSLNVGSLAPNRFRLPFDLSLTQNGSITIRYSQALGLWVQLS